ncbi:MAG TPA: glycosyltransferase [Allocoleopsis sp.]
MKIGVGITTYQRFDRFKECFENLMRNSQDVTEILIVDDCSIKDRERYDNYFDSIRFDNIKIIVNNTNLGVGACKNIIMKYFYNKNFDYFFTLEDDINIKHPKCFMNYIECSLRTGYDYINFALHGTHNPVCSYAIKDGFTFKIYPNIVGAFTLYTPKLIDKIGYHDERFFNAMEHVEYTYRASIAGLTTPFWKFIDIKNNSDMLEEQVNSIIDSSIRPRTDWQKNINKGLKLFKQIHGVDLIDIPRT